MVSKAKKTTKPQTNSKAAAPLKLAVLPNTATDDASPEASPKVAEKSLGKRELIDRVVLASGIKKKAAKPVLEAVLKELGDALSRGEILNLQPFGKANVKRHKELEHAEIMEVRLRRSKLAIKAAESTETTDPDVAAPLDLLAEPAE